MIQVISSHIDGDPLLLLRVRSGFLMRLRAHSILYPWTSDLLDVSGLRHKGIDILLGCFPNGCLECYCSPASGTRSWERSDRWLLFITTVTTIPFMLDGWAPSAGGFPAMVVNGAFLMKDVVLLAVSFYLLKQGIARVTPAAEIA
jgi:hypothetical protein